VGVHTHLEYVAPGRRGRVDPDIVRMIDDPLDDVFERGGEHDDYSASAAGASAASASASGAAAAAGASSFFSALGFTTDFFRASASKAACGSATLRVDFASLSPLKVPQSPVIFSSAVTCSVGCAPTESQYCARSESTSMNEGSSVGWYLPISSITRPSRLVRESATTMR